MRDVFKFMVLLLVVSSFALATGAVAEEAASAAKANNEISPYLAELAKSGIFDRFGISRESGPIGEGTLVVEGTLADCLRIALQENQELQQRFAEYRAAEAAISQVTSLPDPKLAYTEYLKPVETRVGPQQRAFSVSQSFPWFGTLSLQGDINREKAEVARAIFENSVLEVIAEVKQAYYDLGYLERAVQVTDRHLQLLSQWEDIARVRYSAGSGQYTDVIKAQVELGVLGDRLAELKDQRRPLNAVMTGLLNREILVAVDPPLMLAAEAPELEILAARMNAANPLLKAWDHRAQASLNAERLVHKQGSPSFTVGLNFIQTGAARMDGVVDSGEDALMASLAVSVPIWRGKYKAGALVAINHYEAALSGKRDLANSLGVALERTHFRYRDARRKAELYRSTLLPKGEQSLGAIRSAYEAGTSSFLNLVDAERLLLEFELSQARAEFDVLIQEAMLEKITAGPIVEAMTQITK